YAVAGDAEAVGRREGVRIAGGLNASGDWIILGSCERTGGARVKGLILVAAVLSLCQVIWAGEWKAAKSPLVTRWAKDVSATNALREYPRPQMVRKDWVNLNGVWEFAISDEGKASPQKILVPFCVESGLSGIG